MKLYVAGPMTGIEDFNVPEFNKASNLLEDTGYYSVINPARHAGDGSKPWSFYMRQGIADVIITEGVALLDGWWRSKGANLEVHIARTLEIPCEPVDWWMEKFWNGIIGSN